MCLYTVVSELFLLRKKKNPTLKELIPDPSQAKFDCHFEVDVEMTDSIELKLQEKLKFTKHTVAITTFPVNLLGGEGHSRKTIVPLFAKRKSLGSDKEVLGSISFKIELTASKSIETEVEKKTGPPIIRRARRSLTRTTSQDTSEVRAGFLSRAASQESPAEPRTRLSLNRSISQDTSEFRTRHSISKIPLSEIFETETKSQTEETQQQHQDHLNHPDLSKLFGLPSENFFYRVVSCSYFSPLLVHGRLYISDHHLCFVSRFLGRLVKEVISLETLTGISKKMTTSNVVIQTRSRSFNFLSFRGVDLYSLLVKAWKREDLDLSLIEEGESVTEDDSDLYSLEEMNNSGDHPMKEIANAEFPLTVTVFFKKFFGDHFTRLFHETRGCTQIAIQPWTKTESYGMIREITYKYGIKNFSILETTVNMTQRYTLQKDRLVVTTSVVLRDIPFAESFTIEFKTEVVEIEATRCRASISFCILKARKKVSTSQEAWMEKEATAFFLNWLALARGELAKEKSAKSLERQRSLSLFSPPSVSTGDIKPAETPVEPQTPSTSSQQQPPPQQQQPSQQQPSQQQNQPVHKQKGFFVALLTPTGTLTLIVILCAFCLFTLISLLLSLSSVEVHANQLRQQITHITPQPDTSLI